jgi:predicted ribosomally synthesized peptide with nif11-like leader
MSIEKLVEALKTNPDLAKKFDAVRAQAQGADNSAMDSAILNFAKAEGFNVSAEDIASYEKSYRLATLSDEELENVAGGGCNNTVTCQLLSFQDSPHTGCKICV